MPILYSILLPLKNFTMSTHSYTSNIHCFIVCCTHYCALYTYFCFMHTVWIPVLYQTQRPTLYPPPLHSHPIVLSPLIVKRDNKEHPRHAWPTKHSFVLYWTLFAKRDIKEHPIILTHTLYPKSSSTTGIARIAECRDYKVVTYVMFRFQICVLYW